jgi:hypothetical protein
MKKYVCLAFLSLLMVLPMLGAPCEQTDEAAAKQAILSEKAERFKAEAGFRGEIKYNTEKMNLGFFEGKFNDTPDNSRCRHGFLSERYLSRYWIRYCPTLMLNVDN